MVRIGNANVELLHAKDRDEVGEMIVRRVEAEVDGRGWDKPASVWLIFVANGLGVGVVELGLPEVVTKDPVTALPVFIDMLKANDEDLVDKLVGDGRVPDNVQGVVLVSEAWYVPEPEADTQEHEVWEQYAKQRRFHEHPDRQEIRTALAVLGPGAEVLQLVRMRGEIAPEFRRITDLDTQLALLTGSAIGRITTELCIEMVKISKHDEVFLL